MLYSNLANRYAVFGLYESAGGLLLLRRRFEPWAGIWTSPGGKLKGAESPLAAWLREWEEETGGGARDWVLMAESYTAWPREVWKTWVYYAYGPKFEPKASWEGDLAWWPRGGALPPNLAWITAYLWSKWQTKAAFRQVYAAYHNQARQPLWAYDVKEEVWIF